MFNDKWPRVRPYHRAVYPGIGYFCRAGMRLSSCFRAQGSRPLLYNQYEVSEVQASPSWPAGGPMRGKIHELWRSCQRLSTGRWRCRSRRHCYQTIWPATFQVPREYHNDCSFWRGYNGKRYVYPLPSDDWTDDRHMFSGAFTDADGMPFWFYYGCAQSWRLKTTGAVGTKTLGICFNASTYTYIMVRDYTKAKYEDLKVILVGSVSNSPEDLQIPDKEYKDHILHTFKFQTVPDGNARSKGLFYYAGLNKLLIQLKENGEWITKSAPGIVIPPWSSCDRPGAYLQRKFMYYSRLLWVVGINHWSFIIYHRSSIIDHWSLIIDHWSFIIDHLSFII